MTMPFNVTGLPAMAVSAGYEAGTGLPLAIQIVGHAFDEQTVFQMGAAYEAATTWRAVRPNLA
jgi:aspartyl-tRNA(Asn)/glutamyl-tRNA(Gln) amidotransferase subunit A